MSIQLLEDFNLPDQTLTNFPSFTSTPSEANLLVKILSGEAYLDAIGNGADGYVASVHDTLLDDYDGLVQITSRRLGPSNAATPLTATGLIVALRGDGAVSGKRPFADCYYLELGAGGTHGAPTVGTGLRIIKRVAGVDTVLAQLATTHFYSASAQTVRLSAETSGTGTILRAYLNGPTNTDPDLEVPLIEIYDSETTLQAAAVPGKGHGWSQSVGRYTSTTAYRINGLSDNYRAEDLAFVPAAPALPTIGLVTDPITPANETTVSVGGTSELNAEVFISIRNQ